VQHRLAVAEQVLGAQPAALWRLRQGQRRRGRLREPRVPVRRLGCRLDGLQRVDDPLRLDRQDRGVARRPHDLVGRGVDDRHAERLEEEAAALRGRGLLAGGRDHLHAHGLLNGLHPGLGCALLEQHE
jgi:hypothetical protein